MDGLRRMASTVIGSLLGLMSAHLRLPMPVSEIAACAAGALLRGAL
jgi:hypothetical protein